MNPVSKSVADRLRGARTHEAASQPSALTRSETAPEVEVADSDSANHIDRNRSICDHMFLGNSVLGLDFQDEHRFLFGLLPQRMAGVILDDPFADRLILWPRFSMKTSAISVDIMQAILHDQNVRILYLIGDDSLGQQRRKQIAGFFEEPTPEFQSLFPQLCALKHSVSQYFTVHGRTDRSLVDPTFTVSTPKSNKVGGHYNLIYIDDLVDRNNSTSPEMRDKMFQLYKDTRFLLAAGGRIIVTGTTYHEDDAYGRIRKAADARWLVDVRACWSYRCVKCGHKDLWHGASGCKHASNQLCPCSGFVSDGVKGVLIDRAITRSGGQIGYTVPDLERERSEAGSGQGTFACQMENDPRVEAAKNWPKFTDEVLEKFYGRIR